MNHDDARRCAWAVSLAALTGYAGRWVAARLSDGGTDGVVYDTRADAVRHQLHERQCTYIRVPPDGMTPRHAEVMLRFHRATNGIGGPTPDHDVILPLSREAI